ncbi:MAG TPA: hypothetical protein VGG33_14040 [Polyangia bacterium]
MLSTFANTTNHPSDFIGNAGLGALQNNFGSLTKSRAISSSSDAKDRSPAGCPVRRSELESAAEWSVV